MTAFICCPYKDRVEIVSDGAIYAPDGVLIGTHEKVLASPVVPLALVGSGAVSEIAALAGAILSAAELTGSVDDTLDLLIDTLAEIAESANLDTGLRMAIGAISETRGPVSFVFSTFAESASGERAFELREMTRCFAQGAAPTGEELAAYGRPLSLVDGLETDAVFLFESMRRQKLRNPAAPEREPFHSVGGHIDMTIVRAEGYERRRLHTWPDRVGEMIRPQLNSGDNR